MDVQRIGRANLNRVEQKVQGPTASVSFAEVMGKQRDEQAYERINQLMQKIDDQGKVLAETRTVDELRKYKALIKEFMEDAVSLGLRLEEKRGFNRRGRTKVYKIVQEVDRKLLDLTNAVLDKQKRGLDILDMVGEIKGLIVNIYA
ncbi:YaaR family protein [Alkalihalobacterium chitinilyticum]|uniref:YaaR family protein n=1 Tax=Alkalihalobacterium chitinilyticum TaxID=2980103 RepID=A0ABT5V9P5_9BACI|nr:YaaR family protein [Alkalihalobacterium chitinilyticum]MDE5412189.1 YaaR family protein [Alkalihalobacterium chitinilyticum]